MTTILICTPYYPPERGAPQQRWSEIADLLQEEGADVTVATNFPHYPLGRTYQGYRWRPYQRENLNGVAVRRFGNVQAPHRGFLFRMIDQITSCLGLALAVLTDRRAEWVLLETPPLFSVLPLAAARIKGRKAGVYVADLWPESAVDIGVVRADSMAAKVMAVLARYLYSKSDLVMTTSQVQHDHCARYARRCILLPSAVDIRRFPHDSRPRFNLQTVVMSYVGTFGLAHGLDWIVGAASQFPANVRLRLLGDGAERVHLKSLSKGSQNVEMLEPVSPSQIPHVLAASTVGVVSLRGGSRALDGVLPSKLFEYMAAGLPVLVIGKGEVADLVNRCGNGIVVAPGDLDGLLHAVGRFARCTADELSIMSERGRTLVEQRYSRRAVASRLLAALRGSSR